MTSANNSTIPVMLSTPFKKIALALSGGGFRAAAFSLGTLSYLNRVLITEEDGERKTLLDQVDFVGSASGGTFTAMLFTMHVIEGKPFKETYNLLLEFLADQRLLDEALTLINNDAAWSGEKSRNFINAFSRIYDKKLFGGQTFSVYQQKSPVLRNIEICINTTEFYRGLSFRFQTSNDERSKGIVGNRYLNFEGKQAGSIVGKIKLGDIMAASSCFPAGFEPILYPKDFQYCDTADKKLSRADLQNSLAVTDYNHARITYEDEIGLMDGGINDNQALYSTMMADKRLRNGKSKSGFDLIIVTDVASYFMEPYKASDQSELGEYSNKTPNQILNSSIKKLLPSKFASRIRRWGIICWTIFFFLLAVWFTPIRDYGRDFLLIAGSIIGTLCGCYLALNYFLLKKSVKDLLHQVVGNEIGPAWLKKNIPAVKRFSDDSITQILTYLGSSSMNILRQMGQARLNSMLSLVLDVNLKQTRRLIFGTFYGELNGDQTWKHKRVHNVIYELSSYNQTARVANLKKKFFQTYGFGIPYNKNAWAQDNVRLLTEGCNLLEEAAEEARKMGTTLWTDSEDQSNDTIKKVVACGQFTTCANLLEYVLTIERVLAFQESNPGKKREVDFDSYSMEIFNKVKGQLVSDWEMFKQNPYFVFQQ